MRCKFAKTQTMSWESEICALIGCSPVRRVLLAIVMLLYITSIASPLSYALEPATLPPVDSILALANTAVREPSRSRAFTVLDITEYRYSDSLHATRSVHRAIQLLDSRGIGALGDSRLTFSRSSERLIRISARTILPSGEAIPVAQSEFRIKEVPVMSSSVSLVQWIYPRLETGAIVEYRAEFELTLDYAYDLSHRLAADDTDPIRHRVIAISCPAKWPIEHWASDRLRFSKSTAGGMDTYRWIGDSLPGSRYVPAEPEWVTVFYARKWADVTEQFWSVYEPHVRSDSIIRQVGTVWAPTPISREAQISTLFDTVSTVVRYEMTPLRGSPQEPRPPKTVLETRYGDCKDKATLLVALLRSKGIDAYPALVSARDTSRFELAWPDAEQFEHMIVYTPENGGQFMDPTCDFCSWKELPKPYQGKPALILGLDGMDSIVFTPVSPDSAGSEQTTVRVDASSFPVTIDIQIRVVGDRALKSRRATETTDPEGTRVLVGARTYHGLWKGSRLVDHELKIGTGVPRSVEYIARYENDSLFAQKREKQIIGHLSDLVFPPKETFGEGGLLSGFASAFGDERSVDMLVIPGPEWQSMESRISWTIDTTWFSAQSDVHVWDDSSLVSTRFRAKVFQETKSGFDSLSQCLRMLRNRAWHQSGGYRRLPDPARMAKLQAAMAESPDDPTFPLAMVEMYLGDDYGGPGCTGEANREKVRELLGHVRRIRPEDEDLLIQLVHLLLDDERPADADSIVREYLSEHSTSVELDWTRVSIAIDLCEYQQAADLLKKSGDASPMDHATRADVLAELGDRQGAESELELLEMLGADEKFILRSRIGNLIALNDFKAASALLAELPDADSAYQDSVEVAIAQKRGDHATVAAMLAEMLRYDPDNARLNNDYAWEQARTTSQLDRALESAQKAVLLESCLPNMRNTLGYVLLKLGRTDEAREEFMLAMKSQKAESRTVNYYCLGECDRLQGDLSSASRYYRLARDGKGNPEFSQLAVEALSSIGETGQKDK